MRHQGRLPCQIFGLYILSPELATLSQLESHNSRVWWVGTTSHEECVFFGTLQIWLTAQAQAQPNPSVSSAQACETREGLLCDVWAQTIPQSSWTLDVTPGGEGLGVTRHKGGMTQREALLKLEVNNVILSEDSKGVTSFTHEGGVWHFGWVGHGFHTRWAGIGVLGGDTAL